MGRISLVHRLVKLARWISYFGINGLNAKESKKHLNKRYLAVFSPRSFAQGGTNVKFFG